MPYLTVNGIDHFYEWVGGSASGNSVSEKPVLVFIHGWAGSARYWQQIAQALASDFRCLLYDMRGFGRSQPTSEPGPITAAQGYELDTFADDLATLLNQLQLGRVYLMAHSMGASVAVFFLNRYSNRVERGVLTCNGVFEYDEKAFAAFYRFGGYVVAFRPTWLARIPLMPRLFMARFLHRPIPSVERLAFLQDFLRADYDTALGTIFTSVSKKATEVMPLQFQQITVPTLLISGEFDQITPAEMGRQAAALNPGYIDYVMMPKTAHFPMLEDPETYLTITRSFLLSQS
ncbi:Alpha/beta hydrolase [Halomicronema hongdechloris C2206]|uniref:Alpha/beta hydrolase n=1 Tax=Halomicronema hongdechloris C2206 TaxID=1641165 RepID=A0A1Z3HI52_9CYAN|nr:alpha/beta hydrolase [Halomicronema hongdechloris]ASC69961.1 Alpha/beta hydrolase [Halomicronema hongdechloris C2206]